MFFYDLFERLNPFDKNFPFFVSFIKFILNGYSVMIMFSIHDYTIDAEKLLSVVIAGFYITVESLNGFSIAVALFFVI